jgi:hypothetical protein
VTLFISYNKKLILLSILDEYKEAGRQQMDCFRVASEFQYYYYYYFRECLCAKYKFLCSFGSVFAPNIKILIFESARAVNSNSQKMCF